MKVSLSIYVAFWRNLLCCLADCPSFTLTFLKLIFPLSSLSHFNLSQVSLLSLAISLLQFYALITMCYSGVTTFSSSLTYLSSLRRFQLSSEEMRRAVQAKISKRASELNTKKLRSLNIITENIAEAVRSTILNGIVGGVAEVWNNLDEPAMYIFHRTNALPNTLPLTRTHSSASALRSSGWASTAFGSPT